MPHSLLIFSQSDYLIQVVDTKSHTEWQTVQIHISWLLQKPTDLDLHCFKRQGISGLSRTRVKEWKNKQYICNSRLYTCEQRRTVKEEQSWSGQQKNTTGDTVPFLMLQVRGWFHSYFCQKKKEDYWNCIEERILMWPQYVEEENYFKPQ